MINELVNELIRRVFLPLPLGEGVRGVRLSGLGLWIVGLFLFSCTENRDLKLRGDSPEPPLTSARVSLGADWEASGLAAHSGTCFYFYPASGSPFTRDCPAEGFVGEMAADSYRVVAVGSDFRGVELTGMESYETAAAVVPAVATRADGWQVVGQPENVCRLPFDAFTAEGGGEVVFRARPAKLGSTVRLTFTVAERERLSSLEGTFQGVYPSVLLSTGAPSVEGCAAAATTVTPFSVALAEEDLRCDVHTLGVLYPAYGEVYTNLLGLTAVSTDGQVLSTQADLTEELSRAMEANGGLLPVSLSMSVRVDVRFEPEPVMEATATVQGWNDGGSTEGDVWD